MNDLTWPLADGGRALEALVSHAGIVAPATRLPPGIARGDPGRWIASAAATLGIEAEPVSARHAEVEPLIRASGPAMYSVDGGSALLVVVRARGDRVEILAPDGHLARAPIALVVAALTQKIEAEVLPEIEATLAAAGVTGARAVSVRKALMKERLATREATVAWTLRADPGEDPIRALARVGLVRLGAAQVAAHLGRLAFTLGGWWLLGRSMFSDRLDPGSVIAVGLLFGSAVACELGEAWLSGTVSLRVGAWLRQRLLIGSLRQRPDDVRVDGLGAHLGRVVEAESVQAALLTTAMSALLGVLELVAATVVLAVGAGGIVHAGTLALWVVGLVALLFGYAQERRKWTEERLRISARGIERMLGYETRLMTEPIGEWSLEEDQELSGYVDRSRAVDARLRRLSVLIARGWLVFGLFGLVPSLIFAEATSLALAVAIGGVLVAYEALGNLSMHAALLVDAVIGWRQVAPFFAAASERPRPPMGLRGEAEPAATSQAQLELRDVSFTYPGRSSSVLEGVSLRVETGERILLEGRSGAGKSTLAALLGGLRSPTRGLVLKGGLDIHAIGEEPWRRSIAVVPQFHENHMLTGTLAFNLLLGRQWPPSADDLALAEKVCRELGLGHLLDRMPSELMTMVGETGWQLSHGERSRVFLARALLQEPSVLLLDETFAALDPENLAVCIQATLDRARTLIVIAHARAGQAAADAPLQVE